MKNIFFNQKSKILLSLFFFVIFGVTSYSQVIEPPEIIPPNLLERLRKCRWELASVEASILVAQKQLKDADAASWEALDNEKKAEERFDDDSNKLSQNISAVNKFNDLQKSIVATRSKTPIIISNISVGNTDINGNFIDFFGSTLKSSRMDYLMPIIYYSGLKESAKTLRLNIRIRSYGSLTPVNYSYDINLSARLGNDNQSSVGSRNRYVYPSGIYILEIWHEGNCLGQTIFIIEE